MHNEINRGCSRRDGAFRHTGEPACSARGRDWQENLKPPGLGLKAEFQFSVLTGLVEPWDDHLEESVCGQVSAARNPVITTGRIGLRYARLLFPDREVILVGSKIGAALDAAQGSIILCGLPAVILRHKPVNTGRHRIFHGRRVCGPTRIFPVMLKTLEAFKEKRPVVHVVLVDRNGAVIGETP